jgi:cob(I)alamin adenosyltransferase
VNSDEERAHAVTDTDFAIAVVQQAAAQTEERIRDVLDRIQVDLILTTRPAP